MADDSELDTKKLDQIIKAISKDTPVARVGILGQSNARTGKANSNATVGAAHEFGTSKLPQRSFLRVPISEKMQEKLDKAGALDKDVLIEVVNSGSVIPWLKKIALLAENIVLEAFDTGGFGKWKPSNMTNKKNHQTLVETQQLRNSITNEVKAS